MTIVHRILEDGAFVAGDTATRRTRYAYPTSHNAVRARRHAAEVAADMMRDENAIALAGDRLAIFGAADERNWTRLE